RSRRVWRRRPRAHAAPPCGPWATATRSIATISRARSGLATPCGTGGACGSSARATRSSRSRSALRRAPAGSAVGASRWRGAARRNQAFWVEIYTSRDLAAGIYEGRVEVDADGRKTAVPVELELFDFTLPDENSMHAMVYYESSQPELYQGRDLDAAYHRF